MSPPSALVGTVARVLSVLRAVAEAEGTVGVKDIAVSLRLPMSTSHRMLDLLLETGFVEKDRTRRRYGVGAEFFRIASLVTQKTSLPSLVQPLLDELTRKTGETALLGIYLPAQDRMIYAAKRDSPDPLRYRIELFVPRPLEWGASGLAILAFLPEDVRARIVARTGPSPTGKRLSREAHQARLTTIRRAGFAVTEGEKLPDSVGIAVPLRTVPGAVVGSLALTIPKVRFDRALAKRYVEALHAAATRFSSQSRLPQPADG